MKQCFICNIGEDKTRIIKSKDGYICRRHYLQKYKYGSVLDKTIYDPNEFVFNQDFVEIKLRDKYGKEVGIAIIDIDDFDKVKDYKWHIKKSNNTSYCMSHINNEKVFLHRFLLDYSGELDVDHIDHNGLNNRRDNLRIISHAKNITNQHNTDNGIYKVKSGRFRATITKDNKSIYIGTYDTFEEAKIKRLEYENNLF